MEKLIHRDYWNKQRVEIIDNGDFRSLYFGSGYLQSRMSLTHPHVLVLSYTHFMVFALLFIPSPQQILIVGVGSGSLVRYLHHFFPHSLIDAVDYSPHIIKLAKGYFCLPQSPHVNVYCSDGYEYLEKSHAKKYDLILIDAFDDSGMAPTIYQKQFFELCEQSLTSQGVASFNLWTADKSLFREIKKDIADSFSGNIFLPVPDRGNVVALTTKSSLPTHYLYSSRKELSQISKKYRVNFIQMVKIAKQNNLTFGEKFKRFFG